MLYVALGRNVGSEPMNAHTWRDYRSEVQRVIETGEHLPEPDTIASGMSNYVGMSEETCVLVWFDKMSPLSAYTVEKLRGIATVFHQEAIAYSISETLFIETGEVN